MHVYILPKNDKLYYEYSLSCEQQVHFWKICNTSTSLKMKYQMDLLILNTLQSVALSYSVKVK